MRRLGLVAVLLGALGPALVADQVATSSIQRQVAEQLKGKVPDQFLAEYQAFAAKCMAALTGPKRVDAQAEKVIAYSIVQVALDFERLKPKAEPAQLKEYLGGLLKQHKEDLAAVTDDLLHRDWDKVRKDIAQDGRTVRELFRAVFSDRPVLVLSLDLNWAAAAGLDDLRAKGRPTRSDWQALRIVGLKAADLSARLEKLLFLRVDETVARQIDRGADYIGTIFLMRSLRYSGPLGEKQRAAIRQHLEKAFLVDQTAVVVSKSQIGAAAAAIRQFIFHDAAFPASPPEFVRMATFKREWEHLKEQAPAGMLFPLSFGKPVPEEVRSGKRFATNGYGENDRAILHEQALREQARDEMGQLLGTWLARLSGLVKKKDRLAGDLLLSFTEQWKEKILSLKEFYGDRTVEASSITPLETAMLDLLRKDRKELPLFTETEKPRWAREEEYQNADWRTSPPSHLRLAADLQRWLDEEYKRKITPEMARAQQYKTRAYDLLFYLVELVLQRRKLNSSPQKGK